MASSKIRPVASTVPEQELKLHSLSREGLLRHHVVREFFLQASTVCEINEYFDDVA